MIHLGLRLTPQGHLVCDTAAEMPGLDDAVAARLGTTFARGGGYGLLRLGAGEVGRALPPVFGWWRDFATRYVTALCHAADPVGQQTMPAAAPEVPAPAEADLAALALTAPLMPGAEYLTAEVLRALWAAMQAALSAALGEAGTDLQTFLKGMNPAWNLVGRCTSISPRTVAIRRRRSPSWPPTRRGCRLRLGRSTCRWVRHCANMPARPTATGCCRY
jgi:hypothetical protein